MQPEPTKILAVDDIVAKQGSAWAATGDAQAALGTARGQAAAGLRAGRAIRERAGSIAARVTGAGLVMVAARFQAQAQAVHAPFMAVDPVARAQDHEEQADGRHHRVPRRSGDEVVGRRAVCCC